MDFKARLTDPVRSERLIAIEDAMSGWGNPAIAQILRERLPCESDEECLILLRHAIAMMEKRSHMTEEEASPASNDPSFPTDQFWRKADFSARMHFLRTLAPQSIPPLSSQAPTWLADETNGLVTARLIRVFGNAWPEEQLPDLLQNLRSTRLLEGLAALDTLIRRNPELLRQDLPALLMAPDAGTRALAVKGLAHIDLDEALAHFAAMLESTEAPTRHQAIKVALSLPFERVKPFLFAHLARETQPDIFGSCLLLFSINPDLETPYRLYELAEQTSADRQNLLGKTIREACQSLQASGLVADDFDRHMERLKRWIQERKAVRFVRQCVVAIQESGSAKDISQDLLVTIAKSLQQEEIVEAFHQALTGELPEAVKQELSVLIGLKSGETPSPQTGENTLPEALIASTPSSSANLTQDEKIRALAALAFSEKTASPADPDPHETSVQSGNFSRIHAIHEDVARQLLEAVDSQDLKLATTAFRTALRLDSDCLVTSGAAGLKSRDPLLVAAAIEYMARFRPDDLFPELGRFLALPDACIKRAAIGALRRTDPAQAISRIRVLLSDRKSKSQEIALTCLISFDFSLVRPLLADYLSHQPESRFFATSLDLFSAFPEPENLEVLADLAAVCTGERAEKVKKVLAENEKHLCDMHLLPKTNLLQQRQDRESRSKARLAKKQAPPAPYSVRVLHASRESLWANLQKVFRDHFRFPLVAGSSIFGLILAAAIGWLTSGTDDIMVPTRSRAILQQKVSFTGTIVQVEGDAQEVQAMVRADDGTPWVILEQGGLRLGNVPRKSRRQFEVSPFRVTASGTILSHLIDCNPAQVERK